MRLTSRFLAQVAPTGVDPEVPETETGLTDEGFDAVTTGDIATILTTTATASTGSGSLTHSDEYALTGGLSLKVSGDDQHYLVFTLDADDATRADHDEHYTSLYLRYSQTPGSDSAFYELRSGGDAGPATQIGITDDGRIFIRDGNSGVGGAYDETAVQTIGTDYLIEATYANNAATVVLKNPTTLATVDTLTCTITATDFSYERVGLLANISGGSTTTGNLDVENFDLSTTGVVSNTNRGTSDQVTGSGALTIDTGQFVTGTKSLRISTGLAYHMYRFDHASHADHYVKFYIRRAASPGSDLIVWQLYSSDNTTVACQLGVNSSGNLWVRDSNSGTKQTASAALTANTWFKVLVRADGAGGITASYYSSGGGYTTLVQTFATATTLTATTFGKENLGQCATTTGTPDLYIDSFEADSVQFPSTAASSPITVYIERVKSDSAEMPEPHQVPVVGDFDEFCAPADGALWGITASVAGIQGHTSPAGLAAWNGVVNTYPQMIGRFYTAGWNGIITGAQEAQMWDPTTGPYAGQHAVPCLRWKPPGTWASIAAGNADTQIRLVANNLKSYGRKVHLTFHHEPEDDEGGTGYTDDDYVAAFQRIVTIFRQEGHPKAEQGGQVVWFLDYVGYSGWAVNSAGLGYSELDPGEEYIDVYGWNPYLYNLNSRDTLDELFKENTGAVSGWGSVGMYTYLAARHPSKWLGIYETGINIGDSSDPDAMGLVNDGFSDAAAAAVALDWQNSFADYPRVKFFNYWSSQTANGYYEPYHPHAGPLFQNAMEALVNDDYFTHDMTQCP